ncbi:MAG: hypothetical protein ACM34K_07580 [Bacillota bacterium]
MKPILSNFAYKGAIISLMILMFTSCSNKTAKEGNIDHSGNDSQQVIQQQAPQQQGSKNQQSQTPSKTAIQINKSEILAEVNEVHLSSAEDFFIVTKLLEVKEDPAYPSIAAAGGVYKLYPGFVLSENKEITQNKKNMELLKLKELKKGDKFRAVISLEENNRWVIQEIKEIRANK